jgi:alkyldihydroxyacetonephosphate synthase
MSRAVTRVETQKRNMEPRFVRMQVNVEVWPKRVLTETGRNSEKASRNSDATPAFVQYRELADAPYTRSTLANRPAIKWWGWGSPDIEVSPSPEFLQRVGGPHAHPAPPVAPALTPARSVSLPCRTANDDTTRLRYSAGRSYLDLLRLRSGGTLDGIDAVAFPETAADIEALLQRKNIAFIPFGGGTSVVGGVTPLRGSHDAVVAIDMSSLNRVLEVDRVSMTVTAEAGIFGPRLEEAVQREGMTLGHYPQSFEYSTLGGWIATRSAGQESTRYGRIEDLVARVEAITPAGMLGAGNPPASSTGPETKAMLVGSEGAFGVITAATMRLHPMHQQRGFRSYLFSSFAEGMEACRALVQAGIHPAVMRLSDETETQLSFDLSRTPEMIQRLFRLSGRHPGAHLLLAFDGKDREVRQQVSSARALIRHALPLGASPGRHWARDRFRHPYLRDALIGMGFMVDTFETAAPWSRLQNLYETLKRTPQGVVACHISHAYSDGASLYFTVIEKSRTGDERAQWQAFKARVTNAIVKHGGTVSHHHAVGLDHKPWLDAERGSLGLAMVRALKRELDPFGIMNPGKLI